MYAKGILTLKELSCPQCFQLGSIKTELNIPDPTYGIVILVKDLPEEFLDDDINRVTHGSRHCD